MSTFGRGTLEQNILDAVLHVRHAADDEPLDLFLALLAVVNHLAKELVNDKTVKQMAVAEAKRQLIEQLGSGK